MGKWDSWLSLEEIFKIKEAAKNDYNSTVIIAGCIYLGVRPYPAALMTIYRAYGDALESRTKNAYLHIPDEYKKMLRAVGAEGKTRSGRITKCTKKEAETAVKNAFMAAGIEYTNAEDRMKRTAAHMHYKYGWTPIEQLQSWFSEKKIEPTGTHNYNMPYFDYDAPYYTGITIEEFEKQIQKQAD